MAATSIPILTSYGTERHCPITVLSSTQLQAAITTTQISSPGTAQIVVHTPANLSGDLGCDSGGNSEALTFTVI
jgi:hypothetical protein